MPGAMTLLRICQSLRKWASILPRCVAAALLSVYGTLKTLSSLRNPPPLAMVMIWLDTPGMFLRLLPASSSSRKSTEQ